MITFTQVVEMSVIIIDNGTSQDYTHWDDHTIPSLLLVLKEKIFQIELFVVVSNFCIPSSQGARHNPVV